MLYTDCAMVLIPMARSVQTKHVMVASIAPYMTPSKGIYAWESARMVRVARVRWIRVLDITDPASAKGAEQEEGVRCIFLGRKETSEEETRAQEK